MRNVPPAEGGWASYVRAAREHAKLTRPALAVAMGVQRSTIYRWETTNTRPEQADVVARFARETGVNLDEALAAAGLRPGVVAPDRPAQQELPMDPQVAELNRKLQDPETSDVEKQALRALLDYVTARARWEAEEEPAKPKRRRKVA